MDGPTTTTIDALPVKSNYRQRIDELCLRPENFDVKNKHCFLQIAKWGNLIVGEVLDSYFDSVRAQEDFVDFKLCIMVRLLFFNFTDENDDAQRKQQKIKESLLNFPFWPPFFTKGKDFQNSFGFWSENHALMFLSSAHLYAQKVTEMPIEKRNEFDIATRLLRSYLRVHIGRDISHPFNGFYEVLAHVYYNYTFCALLNLYDFSEDSEIKEYAKILADRLANQIALATNDQGVTTLTASARTFERVRTKTWGQTINQMTLILTGISIDDFNPTAVTGFLLTSSYEPNEEELVGYIKNRIVLHRVPLNHSTSESDDIYSCIATDKEKMPFLWSAGLVAHPNFVDRTKRFQDECGLTQHYHLKPLSFLPASVAQSFMGSMSHWSAGQNYTGIELNLFKAPGGLILSSFEKYNVGLCGYQQMPWMANIDGVGVWSQSGSASSLGYFEVTNIYSPYVSQNKSLLVAAYVVPDSLLSFAAKPLFERKSYIHWPSDQFDEEMRQVEGNGSSTKGENWTWEAVSSRSPPGAISEISENSVKKTSQDFEDPVLLWEKRGSSTTAASISAADADIPDITEDISDNSSDDDDENLSTVHSSESSSYQIKKKTKKTTFWRSAAKLVNSVVPFSAQPKRTPKFCHRGSWWIARRGSCLIGVACTQKSENLHRNFSSPLIVRPGERTANCQRRICAYRQHAWIIKVGILGPRLNKDKSFEGTDQEIFSSFQEFADHCASFKWTAGGGSSSFAVFVNENSDQDRPDKDFVINISFSK